jgi:hypothetical protein
MREAVTRIAEGKNTNWTSRFSTAEPTTNNLIESNRVVNGAVVTTVSLETMSTQAGDGDCADADSGDITDPIDSQGWDLADYLGDDPGGGDPGGGGGGDWYYGW